MPASMRAKVLGILPAAPGIPAFVKPLGEAGVKSHGLQLAREIRCTLSACAAMLAALSERTGPDWATMASDKMVS